MSGRRIARVRVETVEAGRRVARPDTLAVEEPLEIRAGGRPFTTTMRTPGHDIELAHGLLASEGIISGTDDVASMRYCAGSVKDEDGYDVNTYNVLDVALTPGVRVPDDRRRTNLMTSACGVCGSATIETLCERPGFVAPAPGPVVAPAIITALPDRLRDAQATFASTGGLHAAGLFTADGEPLVVREDVGRHNAVDKVVGWAMAHGRRPATDTILFVSGRTSFELAQKAVGAGVGILAGVSAPSSLAVEVAREMGLTLIGFVRGERFNIYAHPERIA